MPTPHELNETLTIYSNTEMIVWQDEQAMKVQVKQVRKITNESPPGSNTATGEAGEMRYSNTHLYVCIGSNKWKRGSLSDF